MNAQWKDIGGQSVSPNEHERNNPAVRGTENPPKQFFLAYEFMRFLGLIVCIDSQCIHKA